MKPPANVSPAPVGSHTSSSRHRGRREEPLAGGHQHAMLAALDHDALRSERPDGACRLDQIPLAAQLPRLFVVDDQHVHAGQHAAEVVRGALDPVVHRIERDKPRGRHLFQHLQLEGRVNIGEKHEGAVAKRRGDARAERVEHVQLGVDRLAAVEIEVVLPTPAKCLSRDPLQAAQVNSAGRRRCAGAAARSRHRRPPPTGRV